MLNRHAELLHDGLQDAQVAFRIGLLLPAQDVEHAERLPFREQRQLQGRPHPLAYHHLVHRKFPEADPDQRHPVIHDPSCARPLFQKLCPRRKAPRVFPLRVQTEEYIERQPVLAQQQDADTVKGGQAVDLLSKNAPDLVQVQARRDDVGDPVDHPDPLQRGGQLLRPLRHLVLQFLVQPLQGLPGPPEALRHPVEVRGQMSDLVRGVDLHPRRQVPGGDPARRRRQATDGPGQPAGDQIAGDHGRGDARRPERRQQPEDFPQDLLLPLQRAEDDVDPDRLAGPVPQVPPLTLVSLLPHPDFRNLRRRPPSIQDLLQRPPDRLPLLRRQRGGGDLPLLGEHDIALGDLLEDPRQDVVDPETDAQRADDGARLRVEQRRGGHLIQLPPLAQRPGLLLPDQGLLNQRL